MWQTKSITFESFYTCKPFFLNKFSVSFVCSYKTEKSFFVAYPTSIQVDMKADIFNSELNKCL